jgi:hypothetical protein
MKLFYYLQVVLEQLAHEVKLNHDKVTGIDKFKKQFRPHKVYQLDIRGLS